MAAWNTDELDRIGAAEEVRVAARRPNGRLRKPVVVWIVRVNDDVYVRSVNGRNAAWFRGVQATHEGHVWADGVEKDVEFVDVSDNQDHIDAAYRSKYARYPTVEHSPDSIQPPQRRSSPGWRTRWLAGTPLLHPLSGMASGGNDAFEHDSAASVALPPPLPFTS